MKSRIDKIPAVTTNPVPSSIDRPGAIEAFLVRQCRFHENRIPCPDDTPEGIARRVKTLVGRTGGDSGFQSFLRIVSEAVQALVEDRLRYADIARVLESYFSEQDRLEKSIAWEWDAILLTVHDIYIESKNRECSEKGRVHAGDFGEGCRECGECCIGPAAGPISTSPKDIAFWEAADRDDILYFTLSDPKGPMNNEVKGGRARAFHFEACPFLRFSKTNKGRCLIHPVKPAICREFICRDASP